MGELIRMKFCRVPCRSIQVQKLPFPIESDVSSMQFWSVFFEVYYWPYMVFFQNVFFQMHHEIIPTKHRNGVLVSEKTSQSCENTLKYD